MSHVTDSSESQLPMHGAAILVRVDVAILRMVLMAIAGLGVVLAYGFPKLDEITLPGGWVVDDGWEWITRVGQIILVSFFIFDFWVGGKRGRRPMEDQKPDKVDIALHLSAGLGVLVGLCGFVIGWHFFELIIVCLMLTTLWQLNVVLSRMLQNPGMLLPTSFAGMILLGAPLLKLPLAIPAGAPPLSWIDAFFTATSAVCVTGLTVRDTAAQFTPFGQTVICVLIQLGGLGMIIFGSMLAVMLGSRPSLREDISLSQMLHNQPLKNVTHLVRFIVLVTLGIELIGAAAAFPFWHGDLTFRERVGYSLFHSVSAYCNAGFALYSNSLENYRYSPLTHVVLAPLIVLGGLGFPVLNNFWGVISAKLRKWRRSPAKYKGQYDAPLIMSRLSLHTKIAITTSCCLFLYGVVMLTTAELMPYLSETFRQNVITNREQLEPLSIQKMGGIIADATFMASSSRTAGFNPMPMDVMGPSGYVTMMTLMVAGGAPGGTAGGIKVTTLALIILSVWATVRQREETQAFGRRIYDSVVRRATALAAALSLLITICLLLLCMTEPFPFMKILFEVVSASTTTGLSLGITADLSPFGKGVIIVAMFLGRIGPLALLGVLVFTGRRGRPYTLPHEDVMIG